MFNATGSRNWFHSPRKLKIATEAMPGLVIGSITWKNVRHSPAPSTAAASPISSGTAEERVQEEHGERQRERDVDDDESGLAVEQVEALASDLNSGTIARKIGNVRQASIM